MKYVGFRPVNPDEAVAQYYPGWNVYEYQDIIRGEEAVCLLPSPPGWPENAGDYGNVMIRERMAKDAFQRI